MSGVREKGGGGDGSLSVLAWHEPARRGVVSLRRRGTMRSDAAWRDATHRGVARIEPSRFNVAREGVEQVPSQDKLDPCCSARRGDEPSRRVAGRG